VRYDCPVHRATRASTSRMYPVHTIGVNQRETTG